MEGTSGEGSLNCGEVIWFTFLKVFSGCMKENEYGEVRKGAGTAFRRLLQLYKRELTRAGDWRKDGVERSGQGQDALGRNS